MSNWTRATTLASGEAVYWQKYNGYDYWAVEKDNRRLVEPTKAEMAEIKENLSDVLGEKHE